VADGKRAPATWKVTWVSGGSDACDGMNGTTDITVGQVVQASCEVTVIETAVDIHPTAYSFSPTPIYNDGSSGDTALIAGPGFSAQFGMPLVQYFDLSGNLLAQTNVTAVASDGSWASGPVPDISQLGVGTYVGIVSNAKADGSYGSLGAVPVNVMLPPPPPPPPDPCPGGRCINQCYDQGLKQWILVAALLFSVQL
jgi:hypothetical protein